MRHVRPLGSLDLVPALDRPELLADPVREALAGWEHAAEVGVCEIDPALADTAAMSQAYDVPLEASANCIVVEGSRAGEQRLAALILAAAAAGDPAPETVRRLVRSVLTRQADQALELVRLAESDDLDVESVDNAVDESTDTEEKPVPLAEHRRTAILEALRTAGARRVLDLINRQAPAATSSEAALLERIGSTFEQ